MGNGYAIFYGNGAAVLLIFIDYDVARQKQPNFKLDSINAEITHHAHIFVF